MLDRLADRRNAQKRQFMQSIGKNYDPKASNAATHRLGIGAEYCVARALGADFDTRVLRQGNKRGWDVESCLGTIDVKYRRSTDRYETPGYSFSLDSINPDEFKADYGVLVWKAIGVEEGRGYWIVGAVLGQLFRMWSRDALAGKGDKVQIEDWGYGERLTMRAGWMRPFSELVTQATQQKTVELMQQRRAAA